MAQVIRHFEDHVPELQILFPFLVDRIIAEQRPRMLPVTVPVESLSPR